MIKLSSPSTLIALTLALGLSACHKNAASGAASSAASASAAPSASAAASASASAEPAKSAAPPSTTQKAKTEINGKSMSDAEASDIEAALKKYHWHSTGGGGMAMGATKTITVKAKKGHLKAEITLIRPSGSAETGSGMKMASAKEQEADFAKKGATLLDGDALLAVVIKGKKKVAKKLLEELTKK